jgi:PEP-CTERM motif-containing protein
MVSSNVSRFLAVASALSLGALTAPAEAAVFHASATTDLRDLTRPGGESFFSFFLPQYSGPGTIVGVNIGLSGSISATDFWFYDMEFGITVGDYSSTWSFALVGPPNSSGGSFLDLDVPAEYVGGSVPPCEPLPFCGGPNEFPAVAAPTAFSASVDVSDFSDFAGSGTNAFELAVSRGEGDARIDFSTLNASATLTETILAAVPEAPTWAMVLIGFAIVGFAARGRRVVGVRRRAAAIQ